MKTTTTITRIKEVFMWTFFILCLAAFVAWQWIKYYWFTDIEIDFEPRKRVYKKLNSDRFELPKPPPKEKVVSEAKVFEGWELSMSNNNHPFPEVILKTSSLELANYVANNLSEAMKNFGYKSFVIMVKSTKGGIIVTEKKHVS